MKFDEMYNNILEGIKQEDIVPIKTIEAARKKYPKARAFYVISSGKYKGWHIPSTEEEDEFERGFDKFLTYLHKLNPNLEEELMELDDNMLKYLYKLTINNNYNIKVVEKTNANYKKYKENGYKVLSDDGLYIFYKKQ